MAAKSAMFGAFADDCDIALRSVPGNASSARVVVLACISSMYYYIEPPFGRDLRKTGGCPSIWFRRVKPTRLYDVDCLTYHHPVTCGVVLLLLYLYKGHAGTANPSWSTSRLYLESEPSLTPVNPS